jgi:hypothetical protein
VHLQGWKWELPVYSQSSKAWIPERVGGSKEAREERGLFSVGLKGLRGHRKGCRQEKID